MKYYTLETLIICALCSCTDISTNNDLPTLDTAKASTNVDTTNADSAKVISVLHADTLPAISLPASDSIKRFVTDDYPLRDEMFAASNNDSTSARDIRVGDVVSFDKVWFTDTDRKQTIVVELYTDMFRMIEYHFLNNDIPGNIIEQIEFNTPEGEIATLSSKQQAFNGFIKKAKIISNKYFRSNKGFAMNDHKQKAIRMYGAPDTTTVEGDVEILEWNYAGDLLYDGKVDLKGKPLAKNSYGHRATLMFRNDKLVAMILYNDIP